MNPKCVNPILSLCFLKTILVSIISSLLGHVHMNLAKYICYLKLVCFKNSVDKAQTRHRCTVRALKLLKDNSMARKDANPPILIVSKMLN